MVIYGGRAELIYNTSLAYFHFQPNQHNKISYLYSELDKRFSGDNHSNNKKHRAQQDTRSDFLCLPRYFYVVLLNRRFVRERRMFEHLQFKVLCGAVDLKRR